MMPTPRVAWMLATALAAGGTCVFPAAAADTPARKEVWFGPRFGVSHATGVVGIEVQWRHVGVATGVIPICVYDCTTLQTAAIRYYLSPETHSWVVGVFGVFYDHGVHDGSLPGVAIEYRWRFRSGWDLAAGLALADGDEEVEFADPLPSMSWGYSF